jgi:hypothetical protein
MSIGLIALPLLSATLAWANETGFSDMHSQRREGGRTCMDQHFHYGSSSGHASRRQAEVAAVQDWAGFTAFEYGTAWARYSVAASREMSCEQSGGSWSCNLSARPCRGGRGATSAGKAKSSDAEPAVKQAIPVEPTAAPKQKQSATAE